MAFRHTAHTERDKKKSTRSSTLINGDRLNIHRRYRCHRYFLRHCSHRRRILHRFGYRRCRIHRYAKDLNSFRRCATRIHSYCAKASCSFRCRSYEYWPECRTSDRCLGYRCGILGCCYTIRCSCCANLHDCKKASKRFACRNTCFRRNLPCESRRHRSLHDHRCHLNHKFRYTTFREGEYRYNVPHSHSKMASTNCSSPILHNNKESSNRNKWDRTSYCSTKANTIRLGSKKFPTIRYSIRRRNRDMRRNGRPKPNRQTKDRRILDHNNHNSRAKRGCSHAASGNARFVPSPCNHLRCNRDKPACSGCHTSNEQCHGDCIHPHSVHRQSDHPPNYCVQRLYL